MEVAVPLRGLPLSMEWIKEQEKKHQGKMVLSERLNDALEDLLERLKKRNPTIAIKSFSCIHFPTEYFVPIEIEIDPFGLGRDFRSGFHVFVQCQRKHRGVSIEQVA